MARDEETPLEKERQKTLKLLDVENVENKSHEAIPEEELTEASQDPENPEVYSEETEGKIAPLSKAGSSEIDTKKDKRFSRKIKIDEEALRENARETDTSKSGGGTDDNQ